MVKSSSFSLFSYNWHVLVGWLCPTAEGICLDDWWIGYFTQGRLQTSLNQRHVIRARFFLFYTLNDILAADQKKNETKHAICHNHELTLSSLSFSNHELHIRPLFPYLFSACYWNCLFSFNNISINHTGSCVCSRFLHLSSAWLLVDTVFNWQFELRREMMTQLALWTAAAFHE